MFNKYFNELRNFNVQFNCTYNLQFQFFFHSFFFYSPFFLFFFYFELVNELEGTCNVMTFSFTFLPLVPSFFFKLFKRRWKAELSATQKSKVLQTNLNPELKEKPDVHAFTLASSLFSICRIHIRACWNNRQPFFLSKRNHPPDFFFVRN